MAKEATPYVYSTTQDRSHAKKTRQPDHSSDIQKVIDLSKTICELTGASACRLGDIIQTLWSGYGEIQRVELDCAEHPTAIVKHIDLSEARKNQRGWSGQVSHHRKIRSYAIETTFYESYATTCDSSKSSSSHEDSASWLSWRVPKLLGAFEKPEASGWVLVLEDLDAAGFDLRASDPSRQLQSGIFECLRWLANFHATFMGREPIGLWPVGTYWHLATRPEEWQSMKDGQLKRFAAKIDERLNAATFQTLVHGDAKLANFCFANETQKAEAHSASVAAVDFQYVGGGCGMKDVAYLISSCLDGAEAESRQNALLDFYFQQLAGSLAAMHPSIDFGQLESEWRALYPVAWADFCRFLAGWSPGHWKLNAHNDRMTQSVLTQLARGS
jgi:hypothetical protein